MKRSKTVFGLGWGGTLASYRELSRVARIVDGIVDIDALTDEQVDALLECSDDEEELVALARGFSGQAAPGERPEPAMAGEEPHMLAEMFRRGFKVLRGGRA